MDEADVDQEPLIANLRERRACVAADLCGNMFAFLGQVNAKFGGVKVSEVGSLRT